MRFSLIESRNYLQSLLGTQNPVVFEIGCNDGLDSLALCNLFEQIKLVCFEPEPRAINAWKNPANKLVGRATLYENALSDSDGVAEFYQSSGTHPRSNKGDWDYSGSLNTPTGHLEYSPWVKFESKIQVPTITLDTFMRTNPAFTHIDLMWMDVQGGESKVLDGAKETLPKIKYVYTEYGHWEKPLYEGQMSLCETLEKLGPTWKPIGVFEGCNVLVENLQYDK